MKELVQKLSENISNVETRSRIRTDEEYERFLYSLEVILKDVWLGTFIDSDYECRINKNINWYSQNQRYRDPMVTARQHLAVFEGLLSLGLIQIVTIMVSGILQKLLILLLVNVLQMTIAIQAMFVLPTMVLKGVVSLIEGMDFLIHVSRVLSRVKIGQNRVSSRIETAIIFGIQ